MKKTIFLLISLIAFSCAEQSPEEKLSNLEGYWEIQRVEMPDGSDRDYSISTIVDFIELKGTNGKRTKVSPQLDGSFKTNGTVELFTAKIENDSLNLYYKTPYDTWKETVVRAEDSILVIKNRDDKIYSYKKFVKFDF